MAVNKVVYGTTVLVDLTEDTVTPSTLMQGYTAHDKSGALITGTATGGLDLPTFTVVNGVATCNKTYAECRTIGQFRAAYAIGKDQDGYIMFEYVGESYSLSADAIHYVFYIQGAPAIGLDYNSDETIDLLNEAPSVGSATFTENGTYESGNTKVWNSVTVNVPSSTPSLQSKTATPTEQQQTVSPDSGYDGLSSVTVGAISSTYVGSGITQRTSSDLEVSGRSVLVPAGYYSTQAQETVAAGSQGTPTATKGTVSNHSIAVTPSVTNTAGYINGGTKTGTAITVSASELVSGSETKTANGTYNVTNLASLVVDIPFVTYHTSTSEPTSSQGSNGDIWLVTE